MSAPATDQKLADVANTQFLWKNETMRHIGVAIIQHAMVADTLWPDCVKLEWLLDEDSRCVGSCYRLLMKAGVISKTGQFRKSVTESSNGRTIFEYQIASLAKAKTFLARNHALIQSEKQQELFSAGAT